MAATATARTASLLEYFTFEISSSGFFVTLCRQGLLSCPDSILSEPLV
jgi:hypothetical protein